MVRSEPGQLPRYQSRNSAKGRKIRFEQAWLDMVNRSLMAQFKLYLLTDASRCQGCGRK